MQAENIVHGAGMTFYAEMATMATELLTEFGRSIVLTRPSLNFSNITNKPVSGGTTNLTTIGALPTSSAVLLTALASKILSASWSLTHQLSRAWATYLMYPGLLLSRL